MVTKFRNLMASTQLDNGIMTIIHELNNISDETGQNFQDIQSTLIRAKIGKSSDETKKRLLDSISAKIDKAIRIRPNTLKTPQNPVVSSKKFTESPPKSGESPQNTVISHSYHHEKRQTESSPPSKHQQSTVIRAEGLPFRSVIRL